MDWSVYIIRCDDDSLYTGITNNIERRLKQHVSARGAKYFRGHKPNAIVYLEHGHDRSSASKREAEIKKLRRTKKISLLTEDQSSSQLQQLNQTVFESAESM